MSKYADKVSRRRMAALAALETEPEDVYSILPDPAVRKYFRAKAGMYGMTTKPYASVKIEIPPHLFARLESGRSAMFTVDITADTAQALGEMIRDIGRRRSMPVCVFSIPFGARRRVCIDRVKELHADRQSIPKVAFCAYPYKNAARPLRRSWGTGKTAMHAFMAGKNTFRTGSGISGEARRRCKLAFPGLRNCHADNTSRSRPAIHNVSSGIILDHSCRSAEPSGEARNPSVTITPTTN
ncbi:MAG: hypothetical protein ACI4TC_04160 [Kiritimatiellia bacterium]